MLHEHVYKRYNGQINSNILKTGLQRSGLQMQREKCPWQVKGQQAAGPLAKALSTRPSGCSQLSGPRPPGLSVHTLVHIGLQRPPGAWSHPDRRVLHLPLPLHRDFCVGCIFRFCSVCGEESGTNREEEQIRKWENRTSNNIENQYRLPEWPPKLWSALNSIFYLI